MRITAVDDLNGDGDIRMAAEDGMTFHVGGAAETDALIATLDATGFHLEAGAGFTGDGSGLTGISADVADLANDLDCVDCVSEGELDFDPATQAELDAEETARIAGDAADAAALAAHQASDDHAAVYVNVTGDTMTGALTVDADFTVDDDFVVQSGDGQVGVGVADPEFDFHVMGQLVAENDNASSFRLRGPDFGGTTRQSYAGIFHNAAYANTGDLPSRVVFGSNEFLDLELQGSNQVRITAVDDGVGDGDIRMAAEDGMTFHVGGAAETDALIATLDATGFHLEAGAGFTGDGSGLTGISADVADDLDCAGGDCVSIPELDFDPATQAELDALDSDLQGQLDTHDTRLDTAEADILALEAADVLLQAADAALDGRLDDLESAVHLVVDPSAPNASTDGPVWSTIQSAIDDATARAVITVKAGTYTEDLTLKEGVHLRAEIEALAYAVTLNGEIAFTGSNGNARTTIAGFYIQSGTAPVVDLNQGLLEIHNSSIHRSNSGSTDPAAHLTGGRLTLFDSSISSADTDATAVIHSDGGDFWSYRSDVFAATGALRSLHATSGQASVFGPAAVQGFAEYDGAAAGGFLGLTDMRVTGATNGAVVSASVGAGNVILSQVGFSGMGGAAVDNDAIVAHALVVVSGGTGTFTSTANQVALATELPNIPYDNSTSGLAATTVKTALDELAGDADALDATEVDYSNATSGLAAGTVQAAIDEVEGRLDTAETSVADHEGRLTTAEGTLTTLTTGTTGAAAVTFDNGDSGLTATDAQEAIDEVEDRVDTLEADVPQRGTQAFNVASLGLGASDTSTTVSFSPVFAAPPVITFSIQDAGAAVLDVHKAAYTLTNVTASGFTVRISNPTGGVLTSIAGTMHWVAHPAP